MTAKNYEALGRHGEALRTLHELADKRNASLRQMERLASATARQSTIHVTADLHTAAFAELAERIAREHEALLTQLAEVNAWAVQAGHMPTELATAWRRNSND